MSNEENKAASAHGGLTKRLIHQDHEKGIEEHLDRIQREMRRGFELLQKYPKSVTVFGSSMTEPGSKRYETARDMANRIVKETGYAIINGGGPGSMEAVSRGAQEAGGTSIGLRINLLRELTANPYLSDGMDFTYFFTRKAMLAFAAETYIFLPGGFGTFDELFGILTLIQTNKIPKVPIILFESAFWDPLKEMVTRQMLAGGGPERTIDPQDLELFEITDSIDKVVEIIKRAPTSEWWRNIN